MPELDEMDSLEFPCDPELLPTSSELPVGDFILTIKSIESIKSGAVEPGTLNSKGLPKSGEKVGAKVQFVVDEPEDLRGMSHIQRFWIGTDADPKARNPATWHERSAALLMNMFKVGHIGGTTVTEKSVAAREQKVGATVKKEPERKDSRYAPQALIQNFWVPGTRQPKCEAINADLDKALPPRPPRQFGNDD